MCVLFPNDNDFTIPGKPDPALSIHRFLKGIQHVGQTGTDVASMVNAFRAGDGSWTAAVRRTYIAQALNAAEEHDKAVKAHIASLRALEAETLPAAVASRLPAVRSAEAF